MYSVSEEYKNALLQKHITDTIEGNITLKDGTVIELDDSTIVTGSLRITHELCDDYRIGTFNLGSMHIGFFDDSALLRDFSGAKIRLTYKIKTESGWEAVPMGIFIADGQSVVRRRNTVTLTAYDYGILFDCTIGTSIRNMSNNAERIISAVCDRCGVEFGGIAEGLPNSKVTLSPSSERIQSCRDLIGWCAAVLCGYAVIDREGKLKIISARYSVDTEDPTEIIVDKYLTSAERDSIYSTDTRGWIAQMSAYSGGKTKIYKSNMTHDDAHAARAVYYLENNPLTENMSESLCDLINCEWLKYIDAFLQRGITAELYGDPALDVGDIMRCSEGDIDQRKSVVGLVTKQEWRYRDFHTVICASPQLSDGFEESADEESESETEAVGETDNVYPVKVVSQSEKRSSGGGKEYYAGDGLTLAENNQFNLNFASASGVGGVYIMGTKSAVFGEEDAAMGVYKNSEKFAALRTATQTQKGGFFLGDGLVPVLKETTNSEGEKAYTFSDTVQLRLGDGLYFEDNDETPGTLEEERENDLGGRKVSVNKATKEAFGIVKLGELLETDENGKTNVILKAGNGIDISETGIVAVKTGVGLGFDEENNVGVISATKARLGGVKIGAGLKVDSDGTVSLDMEPATSVIIDHEPTASDLTGKSGILVRYDPDSQPVVKGDGTAIFSSLAIYVEDYIPTVTEVIVTPSELLIEGGEETTQQFTAEVIGTKNPSQAVTWSISGNADSGTTITDGGLLKVSAGEIATAIIVTATSVYDTTKSGTATVSIEQPPEEGVWFDNGNQYTEETGGWSAWLTVNGQSLGGVASVGNIISLGVNNGWDGYAQAVSATAQPVDLTNIETIYIDLEVPSGNSSRYIDFGIGDEPINTESTSNSYNWNVDYAVVMGDTKGRFTYSADVSSYKGKYYLSFLADRGNYMNIYKVWGV